MSSINEILKAATICLPIVMPHYFTIAALNKKLTTNIKRRNVSMIEVFVIPTEKVKGPNAAQAQIELFF